MRSVAIGCAIVLMIILAIVGSPLAIGRVHAAIDGIATADGTAAVAPAPAPLARAIRRVGTIQLPGPAGAVAAPAVADLVIDQAAHLTVGNRRIPSHLSAAARAAIARTAARAAIARTAALTVPLVASAAIARASSTGISGFAGLNALDSAIGNGLSLSSPAAGSAIEPPDQGLCVGGSEVVEMTNLELSIYNTSGAVQSGPTTLSTIFGVSPADFLSDPKCYYDAPTNTFYMTVTDLQDISTLNHSSLLIAVMMAGSTTVTDYAIDTTNDGTNGTPTHPGCPCYGDQPLLGADQNGIYVTTNEFALAVINDPTSTVFNGSQIYAISKADLAAAAIQIGYYYLQGPLPLLNGIAASMQPAAPPDGAFDTANGGSEFFMNSLDFGGTGDNRMAVWAMVNTCAIPSTTTTACGGGIAITLSPPILRVRNYVDPPPAMQAIGSIPYGSSLAQSEEQIDTGDDRLHQLVYANGKLYAGLNTEVRVHAAPQAGIEYFMVKPTFVTRIQHGQPILLFHVRLLRNGFVAHSRDDLYYPSIGVTTTGRALMVFSLSGPTLFPSAAYFPLAMGGPRKIHILQAGAGPDDGFSGYPIISGINVARWGDYSAAVAQGTAVWMATEYIPAACTTTLYATDPLCGMTRAPESNWGTYISVSNPPS
ncbi:MAG: hypothetical protein IVW56_12035 [Candidatus Binataceae bacterium]|nr:hypothetical protein [Candidatus Binataceae bacterium]